MLDDLYQPLALILINYGEIQQLNPIRVASVYRDEKLRITGVLDSTSPRRFVRLIVHLQMASTHPDQERVITDSLLSDLPVTGDPNETLVYSARVEYGDFTGYTLPEYTRTGRWQAYIMRLVEDIRRRADEEKRLNNTPIDDGGLFGD